MANRSLEEYLRALLAEIRRRKDSSGLTTAEFVEVVAAGFTADPAPYDPGWAESCGKPGDGATDFAKCEARLLRQIVDLREMRECGILDRKDLYFGVDAPRGGRWYNFEPRQFLECAAAGSIGGWEPGDPTDRQFVPGPVAVLNADGGIDAVEPDEVDRPIHPVSHVTWDQLEDFLICGQIYE